MTDEPEFLRRWSRRKQAARKGVADDPVEAGEQLGADEVSAEGDAADAADSPAADPEAPDLPDIDSLTADSDFKPFLKAGVPKELKNQALRKLWRVDPAFGRLDGLNDYDGDFTDSATVVKGLKTLYKVGRGFLAEPKEDAPEGTADAAAPGAPQDMAEPAGEAVDDVPNDATDGPGDGENEKNIT